MGNAATAKKGDPKNGAYVINIFIYSREDTELEPAAAAGDCDGLLTEMLHCRN